MKIQTQSEKIVQHRQRLIFNAILFVTVLVCAIYIIINIQRERFLLAYIETGIMFLSCFVLWLFKKITVYKHFFYLALVFLALIFTVIVFIILRPNTSITMYAWMFLISPLSYALLGKKWGLYMTILFVGSALFSYFFSIITYNKINAFSTYNITVCLLSNWFLVHLYESSHQKAKYKLANSSLEDSLTKLYNRRALTDIIEEHADISCLTGVILDIDLFKKINDQYGHDAGDTALIFFSQNLKQSFNDVGYVVRMGGEEFCILMPYVDAATAHTLTEDFLTQLLNKKIQYKKDSFGISFSAGICEFPLECNNYSDLLKIADNRLYIAKRSGRGCVVSLSETE